MKMNTLEKWLLSEADGEEIEAVVIGKFGWGGYREEEIKVSSIPYGKVLSFEDARQYLQYEFDSGHGAPGCHAVYAWTKTKVIAIGQYDGATWPYSIPRNPTECMPSMEGV